MKKQIGNIIRWIVTIAIFWYLFTYKVDAKELWHTVSRAHWGWFVLASGLFGVTFWIGVFRWNLLLKTQQIVLPFRRVTAIGFVGHFFNSFLLGATGGDVIKAYYAARQTQTHKHEAVMSVLVDRLIGLIGLFVIALTMMALNARWLCDRPDLRWPSLLVLIVIGAVFLTLPVTMWRRLPNLFPWLDRLKRKLHMRDHITRVLNAYQSYWNHKATLLLVLLLSVGVHVTLFIGVICIGQGLGLDVSWDRYFLILPVINTIASVPITVAGFGVREEMYRRMFGVLGVEPEKAVALSLLSYAVQFVWSLIGGLVYMFWKHEPHMLQHAQEGMGKIEGTAGN